MDHSTARSWRPGNRLERASKKRQAAVADTAAKPADTSPSTNTNQQGKSPRVPTMAWSAARHVPRGATLSSWLAAAAYSPAIAQSDTHITIVTIAIACRDVGSRASIRMSATGMRTIAAKSRSGLLQSATYAAIPTTKSPPPRTSVGAWTRRWSLRPSRLDASSFARISSRSAAGDADLSCGLSRSGSMRLALAIVRSRFEDHLRRLALSARVSEASGDRGLVARSRATVHGGARGFSGGSWPLSTDMVEGASALQGQRP
mmetsp:Transcript_26641/g.78412  ORF Transcript_26641/g.78412 Transcript_26641/m.78412 type:complete len:260 (-) Transcript_26641:2-781(-)